MSFDTPRVSQDRLARPMLTNKGKYGLKALLHLASLPAGQTAQSQEIATANNISKKFLDTILAELRTAGMIDTKKGKGGGYRLSRPPTDIFVGAAIRKLDGPLAPIGCASRTAFRPCQDCDDVEACSIRLLMTEVRDLTAKLLDNTSLEDMRTHSGAAARELMYHI